MGVLGRGSIGGEEGREGERRSFVLRGGRRGL